MKIKPIPEHVFVHGKHGTYCAGCIPTALRKRLGDDDVDTWRYLSDGWTEAPICQECRLAIPVLVTGEEEDDLEIVAAHEVTMEYIREKSAPELKEELKENIEVNGVLAKRARERAMRLREEAFSAEKCATVLEAENAFMEKLLAKKANLFSCPECASGINTRHGDGTRTCGACGASFKVKGH